MTIHGTIAFYSENSNLLYERVYFTLDGRKKMIDIFLTNYKEGYYHILPFWQRRKKKVVEDEKNKAPIIRSKPIYTNLPTYQYKDEVR